jgi:hypothetical protein
MKLKFRRFFKSIRPIVPQLSERLGHKKMPGGYKGGNHYRKDNNKRD